MKIKLGVKNKNACDSYSTNPCYREITNILNMAKGLKRVESGKQE